MSEKSRALFEVVSGEARLDCVYLFYNKDNEPSDVNFDETLTAAAIFADPTKYGGVLRITNVTPMESESGMGLLASSDNGESFGAKFEDGSSVYAAAVVASGAKKESDRIFSVAKLAAPVVKAANAAVMLNAKVTVK